MSDPATLSFVQSQINSLKSDAESAVGDLITSAMSFYNPSVTQQGFDTRPTWTVGTVSVGSIDLGTGMPSAPTLPSQATTEWTVTAARETTLGTTPTLVKTEWENLKPREVALGDKPILEYEAWALEKAREVTLSGNPQIELPPFVWNPDDYFDENQMYQYVYKSEFFDTFLEPRVREYIDSQAYFLAQEVQDALFEMSRQRDIQTYNDAIDMVDRVQARRGFPIPHSMMMAARNEVAKKYQDTYADRNKEITALIADKALQEKMHAMDTGIKMEDIRSRVTMAFNELYWKSADYIIRKYEADIRAAIAKVETEMSLVKLQAEVDMKLGEFDLKHEDQNSQMQSKLLDATIDAYKTDARFVEIQSEIDSKMAALDMQGTQINADMKKSMLQATIEEYKTDARFVEIESEISLKMGAYDLQKDELYAKMKLAMIESYLTKYREDAKFGLADPEIELKKAELNYKPKQWEHEQQIQRLMASIESMKANVETWKTSFEGEIKAYSKAVEYYQSVVESANSILNDITTSEYTAP